jgi:alginate O-acetyltransferase complex protein AlgI
MLFNTVDFIVFFAFAISLLVVIRNRNFNYIFLIIASYFFFYFSNNFLITLLIFSTILDYLVGKHIWLTDDKKKKKKLLLLSIIGNLGLLGFFKYTDFAISQFNEVANIFGISQIPFLEIVLPVGISFYTFQTLSYTIDIYRGNLTPSKSLKEFALFVAFFPQLVAGPILRASHFLPQIREKFVDIKSKNLKQTLIHNSNLKFGLTLMSFGFFKKMFFADNIAPFVDEIFLNPIGLDSFAIILGTIAFGIQLYCDFSGYTDIAIGAAFILGFKIPKNFNFPFFATSPAEFWRRWHISLSSWVKDYVFFPLVMNNKRSRLRIVSSLFVTMFLIGIWHGAGINFIIYGLIHGSYVGIETFIRSKFPLIQKNSFLKSKLGKIISILATQYLIFLSFLAFRIHDLEMLSYSIQKFIFFDFMLVDSFNFILEHKLPLFFMTLFVIIHFFSYRNQNFIDKVSNLKLIHWTLFLILIMSCIIFFYDTNPKDFIYFRF